MGFFEVDFFVDLTAPACRVFEPTSSVSSSTLLPSRKALSRFFASRSASSRSSSATRASDDWNFFRYVSAARSAAVGLCGSRVSGSGIFFAGTTARMSRATESGDFFFVFEAGFFFFFAAFC